MARVRLTQTLRRLHALYATAERAGRPPHELADELSSSLTRADFLARAGAAAGLAALSAACAPAVKPLVRATGAPRIVIVGGGLAGVTCAYRLWQAGIPSTIYEANNSVGGRTWTLRGFFDERQITEHGGEFISSEHAELRNLARELGLELTNMRAAEPKGTEEVYWIHGSRYTWREMLDDYAHVYPALAKANAAAGYPSLYNHHTAAGRALDQMSAREWIEKNVPGGVSSKIGWLLDVDTTTENGGESSKQSALELIYMLAQMPAATGHDRFYLVGTDERYCVKGGNDLVVRTMASHLGNGAIRPGAALVSLRRRADGSLLCTFESQLKRFDVPADHVVLALPFTTLRRVDLSKAAFTPLKMKAINNLGMGTNTKVYVQFKSRPWYALGYDGATYADTGFQQTLEATRGQPGKSGILEFYSGGDLGASLGPASFGPAPAKVVTGFLAGLEPLYPGITAQHNGKAFKDWWTGDPWHGGSYSYWGVGQVTSFVGVERERQGNVHFCGEHTAIVDAGFMNGAVQTGEDVARQILADLRAKAA